MPNKNNRKTSARKANSSVRTTPKKSGGMTTKSQIRTALIGAATTTIPTSDPYIQGKNYVKKKVKEMTKKLSTNPNAKGKKSKSKKR